MELTICATPAAAASTRQDAAAVLIECRRTSRMVGVYNYLLTRREVLAQDRF
jgi:hypothetical protein